MSPVQDKGLPSCAVFSHFSSSQLSACTLEVLSTAQKKVYNIVPGAPPSLGTGATPMVFSNSAPKAVWKSDLFQFAMIAIPALPPAISSTTLVLDVMPSANSAACRSRILIASGEVKLVALPSSE